MDKKISRLKNNISVKKDLIIFIIIFIIFLVLVDSLFVNDSNDAHSENQKKTIIQKPNPYVNKFISEYEDFFRTTYQQTHTPGIAVTIVKDTSILLAKTYGVTEAGTSDSVNMHTAFRLASVSKGFASILTGIYVNRGMLKWNDEISKYISEEEILDNLKTNHITINHLLSHTTGLPYHAYTNLIEYGTPDSIILQKLQNLKPIAPAGTQYSYQNVAYSLIEDVLYSVTNTSYDILLEREIFQPLHMHDASANYQDFKKDSNSAQPHLPGIHSARKIHINDNYYNFPAAGGINASISDMGNWIKALLGNNQDILPQSLLDSVFQPYIRSPIEYRYRHSWNQLNRAYYAKGWRVFHCDNDTIVYHGGYVNGYRAEIAISRNNDLGICVLANAPSNKTSTYLPSFFDMYQAYADSIRYWEAYQRGYNMIPQHTNQ